MRSISTTRQLVSLCSVDELICGPGWVVLVEGWDIDALAESVVSLSKAWSHTNWTGVLVALLSIVNLALAADIVPEVDTGAFSTSRRGSRSSGSSVWAMRVPLKIR